MGQSGQSDGVKGSKTQVQNGDVTVTTLRKRILTSGDIWGQDRLKWQLFYRHSKKISS